MSAEHISIINSKIMKKIAPYFKKQNLKIKKSLFQNLNHLKQWGIATIYNFKLITAHRLSSGPEWLPWLKHTSDEN